MNKTPKVHVPTIFMVGLEQKNRCVWLQEEYNQFVQKKVVFVGQIHDTLHFQQATNNVDTNESMYMILFSKVLRSYNVLGLSDNVELEVEIQKKRES